MSDPTILIRPEPTPNPNSVRFVVNRVVLEHGSAEILDAEAAAKRSPLAAKLFALEGVTGVLLGAHFVTISAQPGANWRVLAGLVMDAMRERLGSGQPSLVGAPDAPPSGARDQDEVTRGVLRVIDEEIRPAVAMDGGDVVFDEYRDGVVRLHMRGSCHGCPSAAMTLKMGIERRLQEEFPEIVAVEAV
jgi:Fe-S cluster biogenesis protein NfuA